MIHDLLFKYLYVSYYISVWKALFLPLVISRHLRVYPDGALNSMNGFSQPGRRVGCPRSKEIHLAGESFPGSTPDPRRISSIGFVA